MDLRDFFHHAVAESPAQTQRGISSGLTQPCADRHWLKRGRGWMDCRVTHLQPALLGVQLHFNLGSDRRMAQRVFNQVANHQAQQNGVAHQLKRTGADQRQLMAALMGGLAEARDLLTRNLVQIKSLPGIRHVGSTGARQGQQV